MTKTAMANVKQGRTPPATGLRRYLVPAGSLFLVIAVTVALFVFRHQTASLGNWGYLGAFLIGLVANATVILPMPSLLLLFPLGVTFNPVMVGLTGAVGGALGEMAGYAVGYSGNTFINSHRLFPKAEKWMGGWGSATVFLFSLVPFLPIDIVGVASGALRFSIWKFLAACFAGKAILYVVLTLTSAWGWSLVERWFN